MYLLLAVKPPGAALLASRVKSDPQTAGRHETQKDFYPIKIIPITISWAIFYFAHVRLRLLQNSSCK